MSRTERENSDKKDDTKDILSKNIACKVKSAVSGERVKTKSGEIAGAL